jgi:hypothetical protein
MKGLQDITKGRAPEKRSQASEQKIAAADEGEEGEADARAMLWGVDGETIDADRRTGGLNDDEELQHVGRRRGTERENSYSRMSPTRRTPIQIQINLEPKANT